MMNKTAVFTISSANYFAQAKTLLDSLKTSNPDWDRCYALVDEPCREIEEACGDVRLIRMEELPIPDLDDMKFRYNVMELNTAIKPFVFLHLFRDYERVVYLDPDIFVYEPMTAVNDAFDRGYEFVVTPHFSGYWKEDGQHPDEPDIMIAGVYNFGFFAAARSESARTAIGWWAERLSTLCVNLPEKGIFVDQKWMDLLPGRHEKIFILRDNGYNTAYWNLSHRRAAKKDGQFYFNGDRLVFFHFSGFNPKKPEVISKHQTRYAMEDLGPAAELFAAYGRCCMANRFDEWNRFAYSYDHFRDGRKIHNLFRLLFREEDSVRALVGERNPFDCGDVFYDRKQEIAGPMINYIFRTHRDISVFMLNFDRAHWVAWIGEVARKELRLDEEWTRYLQKALRDHLSKFESVLAKMELPLPVEDDLLPGVNLIGYVASEHGVGEACRLTARALSSTDLNWDIYDYEFNNPSRKTNTDWKDRLTDQIRYKISIFNINADQMAAAREHLPAAAWAGYRIGIWYWELPEFPDQWKSAFDLVDEIWAPTAFVRDALRKKTDCPVYLMSPGICREEPPAEYDRAYYGLPAENEAFLFLHMFDVFSYTDRKNPGAVITAFKKAFRGDDRKAGLVLKVNNINQGDEDYKRLQEEIGEYRNIYILTGTMTRDEINGLICACDASVSLHRSEGLGLLCMESMYFGKPVIATNWSGNIDFMTEETACLVDYRLIPVERYYGSEGMRTEWAEPDVEQAAGYMRRLFDDREYYNGIAERARDLIRSEFSPEKAGRRMAKRIREILERENLPMKSALERERAAQTGQQRVHDEKPIDALNRLWPVDYNRPLEETGRLKGPRLFIKRLIRKSLRFLIAPVIDMQREYNMAATQVINELVQKSGRMEAVYTKQLPEMMEAGMNELKQVENHLQQVESHVLRQTEGTMRQVESRVLQQTGSWYNALVNLYMQMDHKLSEEKESGGSAAGGELKKAVTSKWKLIDKYFQEPSAFVCPVCRSEIETGKAERLESEDIFGGGKLVRYRCPHCGAIAGPNKMLSLTDEELSEEYAIHYQINVESGSSEAEKETFMDLKPEKGKRYLDYGCGGWNDAIGELREQGYDVWGFDPYAPNTSEYVLTDFDELRKQKFDGIFSHDLLEHLRRPDEVFALFGEILRPGGVMAHSTACYKYVYEYDRFHLVFYTGKAVETLCEQAGFEVIDRIEDDSRLVYNWIYRKRG